MRRVIAVVVLGLVALVGAGALLRPEILYRFEATAIPPQVMPRTEARVLPAHGRDPALTVWVTAPLPGRAVVVYFMGTDGALAAHELRLAPLAEDGFGIVAMAYRGGGGQAGRPGLEAFVRDAQRVYAGLDTLIGRPVPDRERVIWGYSLGAGIAARLAAGQEEAALVLEAPYARRCDTGLGLAATLPGACLWLRGETLDVPALAAQAGAPVLVLVPEADPAVPSEQAEAVFAAAREPKFRLDYPGATRVTLPEHGATEDAMRFIRTLRGAR